jgi:Meckel syndrome type 1 protein
VQEPPRIDLALEITAASRSLMMFTLEYRLTIANRSERAVGDLNTAMQLACARAGAAPSSGAAQGLASIDRIGPHQARSLTGTLQLPLSAIAPLRQGQTPLFVPLVHVTLEGESLPAQVRSFVIGTPSASGRVHPITLDVPPGGIAGLVAQAVAIPPASAAA